MVAFVMIMHRVLGQRPTKVLLTERDDPRWSQPRRDATTGCAEITGRSYLSPGGEMTGWK